MSYGISTLIGPLLTSLFLTAMDYSTLFLSAAAISTLAFALLIPLRRSSIYPELRYVKAPAEKGDARAQISLRGVIASRNVVVVSAICFIFSLTLAILVNLFPIYAVETLSLTPSTVAQFFSMRGLANTATRLPAGRLSDRIGRRRLILLAHAMAGVALLLVSGTQALHIIAFALTLHGSGHAFRSVNEFALLGDSVPRRSIQMVTNYYATSFDLGATVGAASIGPLTALLAEQSVFLLSSLLLFVGVFLASFTKDTG